eukprot:gene19486-24921_t
MYLFQVKSPAESKSKDDIYKLIATVPGNEAFRPMKDGKWGGVDVLRRRRGHELPVIALASALPDIATQCPDAHGAELRSAHYSILMFAAFTTLRQASISLFVNSIRPSGVVKLGAPPMFSSLARISGEVPA